ncbi:RNA-binding protein squid-like [Dermatophagoides pteronyssinus]|uniref:RNA-binding protein squid-like n=1 Tax=Dermatophagoides pteronyssinus TaxID=6956 RepID=A0A6P6Y487_DERPT|nr:RNA-binding protein squid-like [Dermatophagoides pteronyssinus]
MADCLVSNQFSSNNRFGNGTNGGNSSASNDENRKLFLGGLSWETEEKDLFDYFTQFGQVDKVTIKYNSSTGRSRGFGFVTFINDDTVDAVLKTGPHVIKNRTVDPKRPKGKNGLKKIFVGGIDGDMSNDEIRTYFEQFGPIENIERPFDRQRNRSREFCFIIFETGEAAESAVSVPKQVIGGKECDIKVAHQNRNQNSHPNGMGGNSGGMMNRRGIGGSNGGNSNNIHLGNGGGGGQGSQFFKNRNQNIDANWRNSDHPNGNFRGNNDDYSDSHFLTNIDTMQNNNYSNYKPYNNSSFYPSPYWH